LDRGFDPFPRMSIVIVALAIATFAILAAIT
jgi:hypothetical protein